MKLLVTRPEPEASRTAERLRTMGHEAILAPVMTLAPKPHSLPEGPVRGLIATSPNAIRFLTDADVRALGPLPLYHTGEKIAQLAQARGFHMPVHLADSVEDFIPAFCAREPEGGLYLYLCGEARTRELDAALTDGTRTVAKVETYSAARADHLPQGALAALSAGAGVLLYSRRSARLFLSLAGAAVKAGTPFYVLSPAIARVVAEAFPHADLHVAVEATEAALFALLGEGRAPTER